MSEHGLAEALGVAGQPTRPRLDDGEELLGQLVEQAAAEHDRCALLAVGMPPVLVLLRPHRVAARVGVVNLLDERRLALRVGHSWLAVAVRLHETGCSLWETTTILADLGVERSHGAVLN